MTNLRNHTPTPDPDELLDAAARGTLGDDDEDANTGDEIARMGEAAGLVIRDGKPLGGPDPIARRDAHRWENDIGSADDAELVDPRHQRC